MINGLITESIIAAPRCILNLVSPIHILGGGLAGCEAAWQITRAGYDCVLFEMRPLRPTPAPDDKYIAAADVRLASSHARFSTSFARLGLVAEYGLAWLLPRSPVPG